MGYEIFFYPCKNKKRIYYRIIHYFRHFVFVLNITLPYLTSPYTLPLTLPHLTFPCLTSPYYTYLTFTFTCLNLVMLHLTNNFISDYTLLWIFLKKYFSILQNKALLQTVCFCSDYFAWTLQCYTLQTFFISDFSFPTLQYYTLQTVC